MRRWINPAIGATFLFLLPSLAAAQRAIFVVRHAEKATEADDRSVPLSPAGAQRAQRLAAMLKDSGIAAIYSTDFVRTRKTVQPLAEALKLPIQIYAGKDEQGQPTAKPLLTQITRRNKNDVVLVVGHADTLPTVLQALGVKEKIEIPPGEYDNLFLVIPEKGDRPLLLRLRF